jgi:hypothetical protein
MLIEGVLEGNIKTHGARHFININEIYAISINHSFRELQNDAVNRKPFHEMHPFKEHLS